MKEVAEMEPEELLAESLYLLQLCQQDLNFGRPQTVGARAKRAAECCGVLRKLYEPKPRQEPCYFVSQEEDAKRNLAANAAQPEVGFLQEGKE